MTENSKEDNTSPKITIKKRQPNHPNIKNKPYIHNIVSPISRDILNKRKPTTIK